MHRLTVTEAGQDFPGLITRICSEGVGVELQQGGSVVAYLTPAPLQAALTVRNLDAFLRALPKLQDDADAFLTDVRTIRSEFPAEANSWGS